MPPLSGLRNLRAENPLGAVIPDVHAGDLAVTHLKAVAVDHQNGIFRGETDVVERIGGLPPQALDEFIRERRALFSPAEGLNAVSGVGAPQR